MALRRVSVVLDDANNPALRRLLDAIESTANHRRWEKVKGITTILTSTDDKEVVDLEIHRE